MIIQDRLLIGYTAQNDFLRRYYTLENVVSPIGEKRLNELSR